MDTGGNTFRKPHRSQHHDVYCHASFGAAAPECVWVDTLLGFTLELLGSVWTKKGVELVSSPLSCWRGDQNVISRITKIYREMMKSIWRISGLAYSWKLPLTITAVLWKSPHSLVGCDGNSDDVMTADELWKCSLWLDVWAAWVIHSPSNLCTS